MIEVLVALLLIGIASAAVASLLLSTRRALMCFAGEIVIGCRAVVLSDPETGCQYVVSAGAVVPRRDGARQMGCAISRR